MASLFDALFGKKYPQYAQSAGPAVMPPQPAAGFSGGSTPGGVFGAVGQQAAGLIPPPVSFATIKAPPGGLFGSTGQSLVKALTPAPKPPAPTPTAPQYTKPSPPTTAAVTQRVPEYEGALRKLIEGNIARVDERWGAEKAAVSPFTTQARDARIGLERDAISRSAGGQEMKLRGLLAGRGGGDAQLVGALAQLRHNAGTSMSDARRNLMTDYEDRNAAWETDRSGRLTSLATGGYAGPTGALAGLLGTGLGQFNADRGFNLGVDRYGRGDYESDRDFAYGAGRDAVGDSRADREYDYRAARDAVEDAVRAGNEVRRRDESDREFQFRKDQAAEAKRQYDEAVIRGDKQRAEQAQANLLALGFKIAATGALIATGVGAPAAGALWVGDAARTAGGMA